MELSAFIGAIIADLPLAIVVTSAPADGEPVRVTAVNQAFVKLTGFEHDAWIGSDFSRVSGPRTNHAALRRLQRMVAEGQAARVTVVNYRGGTERYLCDIEAHPLIVDDRIIGAVAFEQEIISRPGRFSAQINRPSILAELLPQLDGRYEVVNI